MGRGEGYVIPPWHMKQITHMFLNGSSCWITRWCNQLRGNLPCSTHMNSQMAMIGWCHCDWQGGKSIFPFQPDMVNYSPLALGHIWLWHYRDLCLRSPHSSNILANGTKQHPFVFAIPAFTALHSHILTKSFIHFFDKENSYYTKIMQTLCL